MLILPSLCLLLGTRILRGQTLRTLRKMMIVVEMSAGALVWENYPLLLPVLLIFPSQKMVFHQPPHLPLINVLLDSNKTHDDEDESRGYVMQVYSFLILINSTDLSSFGDFDSSDDDDEPKIKLNVVIKPIDPNALVNAANIHSPLLL